MKLFFKKIDMIESSQLFELFKKYMQPVVEKAIGWDEKFQLNGFHNCLRLEWFFWVEVSGEIVGLVCFKELEKTIKIHLLIIFESHQGNGYGELVIYHLKNRAMKVNNSLKLSCFKNNEPALCLYRKLKFKIVSEDKHFIYFSTCNVNTYKSI